MSESVAQVPTDLMSVMASVTPKYEVTDLGLVASAGDYLPYLTLGSLASNLVKDNKLNRCHWATVKGDNIVDHGKSPSMWVFAWRPKAFDMTGDIPLAYFDPKSDIFNKIKAESFTPNSNKMFGPEYLCFIPGHGFCAFFMGSKTARNEAKNVQAALPDPKTNKVAQPITMGSRLIDDGKNKWDAPVVTLCTQEVALPDMAELQEELKKFLNPVDSVAPVAAPKQAEDRG
jgi:hypothetical protein